MGLDVFSYSGLELVDADRDASDDGGKVKFYIEDFFAERANDIVHEGVYRYETTYHFRAGSYKGYNRWRNQLAIMAGFASDDDAFQAYGGPFWELIHFSDCQGVIGTEVAKKLANDFAQYEEQAKVIDDYFYDRYADFKRAFELAANNGAVRFG